MTIPLEQTVMDEISIEGVKRDPVPLIKYTLRLQSRHDRMWAFMWDVANRDDGDIGRQAAELLAVLQKEREASLMDVRIEEHKRMKRALEDIRAHGDITSANYAHSILRSLSKEIP